MRIIIVVTKPTTASELTEDEGIVTNKTGMIIVINFNNMFCFGLIKCFGQFPSYRTEVDGAILCVFFRLMGCLNRLRQIFY